VAPKERGPMAPKDTPGPWIKIYPRPDRDSGIELGFLETLESL